MKGDDSMDPLPDEFNAVELAASAWLTRQEEGLTATEAEAFQAWLASDENHGRIYARMVKTWRILDRMPEAEARFPVRPWPSWWSTPLALAAAAAVILAGVLFWRTVTQGQAVEMTLATEVGGWRAVTLPDGSRVHLNTDTRLTVRFTAAQRSLRLTRGEAHFDVAKDASRPFHVHVGAVAVQAVGTAFNVRLGDKTLDVLVTEGIVRLDATQPAPGRGTAMAATTPISVLQAGQRMVFSPEQPPVAVREASPPVVRLAAPEIAKALAWRDQRLTFVAEPLAEVVKEFNRYNQHKLVIADPGLAAQRFGGTFRPDRYQVLIDMLEQAFGVEAIRSGDQTLLRLKRP